MISLEKQRISWKQAFMLVFISYMLVALTYIPTNEANAKNVDKKELENAVKTGKTDKLINTLSPEDKQKLLNIMNDKAAMNEILKSPKAQALLKLFGGKNG